MSTVTDNIISDLRIKQIEKMESPDTIRDKYPLGEKEKQLVFETRQEVEKVLDGESQKLVLVIGPCSIHQPNEAVEYAKFIKRMRDTYHENLVIIMRTYFSKPRTTVGWKGLIYDPGLDDSCQIHQGMVTARSVLLEILKLGVPCSMEHLDTISPQYFDDLLSWAAIGARTTESQVHRELASGISSPIGFKNGTGGSLALAVNAIECSRRSHCFMGCDSSGKISTITTTGNPYGHIILRGGSSGPNYEERYVQETKSLLEKQGLPANIFVDFSHGNSQKQFKRQLIVCQNICHQMTNGERAIKGVMVESNLVEGNQNISNKPLKYGISITDACLGLEDSENLIISLVKAVQNNLA